MRRLLWLTAGVALAAVPAVFGLTGNPALSHSVPVRIPSGAVPVTDTQINDDGQHRHDAGAGSGNEGSDKGGHGAPATPPLTGNRGHGAQGDVAPAAPPVIGEGGHGSPATPPVAGKRGHGSPNTPHVDTTPHVSGKGGRGADDTGNTGPTPSPTPEKERVSPASPDTSVSPAAPGQREERPDAIRDGGSGSSGSGSGSGSGTGTGSFSGNHGLDDGLTQGGGSGRKLLF